MSTSEDTAWSINCPYRHASAGIRTRQVPMVKCSHIIFVIPCFGRYVRK